jgi:hypothetical protein
MFIMGEKNMEIGDAIFVDGKLYIYNKLNFLIAVCVEEEYEILKEVFIG